MFLDAVLGSQVSFGTFPFSYGTTGSTTFPGFAEEADRVRKYKNRTNKEKTNTSEDQNVPKGLFCGAC